MGRKADNRRYHTQRLLLILLMGSKCKFCPERRPWRLEFHHTKKSKNGQGGRTSRCQRIRWYWGNGELVLACGKCNKKQGEPPDPEEVPIPF